MIDLHSRARVAAFAAAFLVAHSLACSADSPTAPVSLEVDAGNVDAGNLDAAARDSGAEAGAVLDAGGDGALGTNCARSAARELWAIHGQSNAQGENTGPGSGLPASTALVFRPKQLDVVAYQEPIGLFDDGLAASKEHNLYYRFAQAYHANTQRVPVAVPVFRGATALTREGAIAPNPSFVNSANAPQNLLNLVVQYINQARTAAGAVTATYVLYAGGEYDAFALQSGALTKERYKTDLRLLVAELSTRAGMTKMFAAGVVRMFPASVPGAASNHPQGEDLVYLAQQEIAAEMPSKFAVVFDARTIPFGAPYRNSDSIHLSAAGQDLFGDKLADGVLGNLGCK